MQGVRKIYCFYFRMENSHEENSRIFSTKKTGQKIFRAIALSFGNVFVTAPNLWFYFM